MSEKKHKIIELRSANVKRLRAITIEPKGNVVVVGGKNGAGKSSTLDSILFALSGGKSIPDHVVREGEDKAEIFLRTDSGFLIRRVIKADGKALLDIRQIDEDGVEKKVTSPQALLDKMVGKIAFDPLAFTRLRPQEQVDLLRQVVGVNTDEVDVEIQETFDSRTEASRRLRDAEGVLKQMETYEGVPEQEVAVTELSDKLIEVSEENAKRQRAKQDVDLVRVHCDELASAVEKANNDMASIQQEVADETKRLEDEIERIKAKIEETKSLYRNKYKAARDRMVAKTGELKSEKAKLAELEQSAVTELVPDTDIRAQLEQLDETNRKVRANKSRAEQVEKVSVLQKHVDELTERIESARKRKVEIMEQAKWPIEGLGFADDGVTFNGRPITLMSSAEQLRVGAAIGFSQNPSLPIVLIRDGSLLDEDSLRDVSEIAQKYDGQVWIERVSTGTECSVIIDDGAVVAQPAGA